MIIRSKLKGKRRPRQTEEEVGRQYKEVTGTDFASSTRTAETGQYEEGLLRDHLWCPNNLVRLWDRIE